MKLTNKHNLPEMIFNALCENRYSGKNEERFCSVTDLLRPPFQLALQEKYRDQIEEDVMDRVWMVTGSALHEYIQNCNRKTSNILQEERLFLICNNHKITGGIDCYHATGVIYDYKITNVWNVKLDLNIKGPRFDEYTKQLNCYRRMYTNAGFPVERMEVVAIIRDWSKRQAQREKSYPQTPIIIYDIPFIEASELYAWINTRINEIENARANNNYLSCSASERWERPAAYAVKSPTRKTAIRVFEDKREAEKCLLEQKAGCFIEERPGESVRCVDYCNVNKFCPFFGTYSIGEEAGNENKN